MSGRDCKRANILVVDDSLTNQKLISYILEYDGYQVLTADTAEIALSVLKTSPVDLILMDIALPGMDGLELTRILKADDATSNIPVIALTAFAMKGDDAIAREAGCDGYITKPFDTREISAIIAQFLTARAT